MLQLCSYIGNATTTMCMLQLCSCFYIDYDGSDKVATQYFVGCCILELSLAVDVDTMVEGE
eukprot:8749592-Ditylum_brightwellii.AAC.1